MDEALLGAFRNSHYLVCLNACEWADIRIDQALPESLQQTVTGREWGFITAWNPLARRRAETQNLAAQRQLQGAVMRLANVSVLPAIGVGDHWHEPSLFVNGAKVDQLDALARQHQHQQLAYIHGTCGNPARLRLLP